MLLSGTIVNNMEGSDILKSSNFNMASQLLEVRAPNETERIKQAGEPEAEVSVFVCVCSGRPQGAGESSDAAFLHDQQGKCDQILDLRSGRGRKGRLRQSTEKHESCFDLNTVHDILKRKC